MNVQRRLMAHLGVKQRELAHAAAERWDGCSWAELILDLLDVSGEDVRETLAAAEHKRANGLYPPPCSVRLWNDRQPAPRTCERCNTGPCVYGETRKENP